MAPPFNINNTSPADNALISAFPNDERANRTLIEDWLSWISDPATGDIRESVLPPAANPIPSGTKMLFVQTAAPTGFTKDVTHNNKALRIVNGTASSGGTTAFTSVFASRTPTGSNAAATQGGTIGNTQVTGTTDSTVAGGTVGNQTSTGTVGGTAITIANLPVHDHGASGLTFTGNALAAHSHTISGGGFLYATTGAESVNRTGGVAAHDDATIDAVSAGTPSGTIGGTTASTGSGTTHTHTLTMNAHNHSFTGSGHTHTFTSDTHNHTFTGSSHSHTWTGVAMDFAVQYVDVIIATKD